MKEYTSTGEVPLETNEHLLEPLFGWAEREPSRAMLATRKGDQFVDVSARDFADNLRALAKGLIGLGVEPGQRVGLMSGTRIEWVYLDYAILAAGGVTVPIYETSSEEQIEWILSDSEAVAAFFENDDLHAEYEAVSGRVEGVKRTFVIDRGGLDELRALGEGVDDDAVDERVAAITTDDVATLIYTSGTTGRPKGCVLTHGNLRWDIKQTVSVIGDLITGDDSQLLFLPLAHSFAKILMLSSVEQGVKVGFATSPQHLTEEMPIFRPTYVAAVPRIFEKVFTGAQQRAHGEGKGRIFDKAADVAIAWSEQEQAGGAGLGTKVLHGLFDRLVYGKIRDVFGGRLEAATSGGGPLGARLAHFFNGVGIQVYEGYGLTETSPVLTANHPDAWKIGTVGRPVPGTTIRIADDGEVLAKGGQIFQGYWKNEEATNETVKDGWFHTGDIGELDDDGFLSITGRKKEIIVTAGGKNVAPAVLEDRLRSHPLVSQAMVVGDDRPFIAALLTIDEETLPGWAERNDKEGHKVADLVDDPDLQREVEEAVEHANKAVSRAESIRKFKILPEDFTIEGGELTPTMKVKRRVVADKYDDEIDELYTR